MSHQEAAEQNHYVKVANKYLENVAKLKYLGMTVTYQNCVYEEIKSRINLKSACYHAVQNLFVFPFASACAD
jgi:hypothetical protein